MIRMKTTAFAARTAIHAIPHRGCSGEDHWHTWRDIRGRHQAKAQSICWLFCWATNGMGSEAARVAAREAFDAILEPGYEWVAARLTLKDAYLLRYIAAHEDREQELAAMLQGGAGA